MTTMNTETLQQADEALEQAASDAAARRSARSCCSASAARC